MPNHGKGGRPKQPTAYRQAMGADVHSRYNQDRTDEEHGLLTDEFFGSDRDYTREEYAEMVNDHLKKFRMKTKVDKVKVVMLLDALENYQSARRHVRDNGTVIMRGETPIKNPAVTVMNESVKTVQSIMSEFAMNPGQRGKLGSDDKTPSNPVANIMARRVK